MSWHEWWCRTDLTLEVSIKMGIIFFFAQLDYITVLEIEDIEGK